MRKIMPLILLSLIFTCCLSNKQIPTAATIFKKYKIIQIDEFESSRIKKLNASIELTNQEKGSAFIGCNQINFNVNQDKINAISFTQIVTTRMYCSELDKYEKALVKILKNIVAYQINSNTIIFKTIDDKKILCQITRDR